MSRVTSHEVHIPPVRHAAEDIERQAARCGKALHLR
jgi:hypothetical protein